MRLLALMILLFGSGCVHSEPAPLAAPAAPGPTEPTRPGLQKLVLKRQSTGADWKLEQDLGSVVLLDVWATWCEPCADSLPIYHQLRQQYGARGLKVYGINVDADSRVVVPFLAALKVDVPMLLDPGANLSESALAVKVMPTAFLIDRKGKLRHVHEGLVEEFPQKYITEIEALLAEQ